MPGDSSASPPIHHGRPHPRAEPVVRGIAVSHDQFFAASLEAALADTGPLQASVTLCDNADAARRVLSAGAYQFAMVDARSDPERAMAVLAGLRSFAPALALILTAEPETTEGETFARQAFALGARDVLRGPPWQPELLCHAVCRAARQTAADLQDAQSGAGVRSDSGNAADRSLMAEVGHEMRSPLGTIIGFAQSIEQEAVGPIAAAADQYRDYARNIRTSGEHLLALFEDLLEIGSATAKSIAAAETVTPSAIVERAAVMVQAGLGAKDLTLHVQERPDAPQVYGNGRLIRQAILNLLQNAIKFTPPGGNIWLECAGESDDLCISVRDDGIGMEQGTLKQLRAHAPLLEAASQRGYGLGLPFVARVAAAHGGRFELESALGAGTTTRFIVPRNLQTPPSD